ncbi:MAG TPA: bifunctional [glutamate--ammonia ligase]-adenylyl-L-tyrosine phosphorylase/[glutamate--ammonia-ligase] adenylyltransferase [Nevskiaceae bacterium]|nr:bifunctional [glutamate--ammonia ligase]-adenylyl-L-tyrosine phosphorylase/[glutamate--ammonia-ligase] adenylyltransferase [Nevskiaceae bacterium]
MDDQWLHTLKQIATPATAAVLERVLAASCFVQRVCQRQEDWARATLSTGGFENAPEQGVGQRLMIALDGVVERAPVMRELRRFRDRELARLAVRDIAGWAGLDETLQGLSDLADADCTAALATATRELARRGRTQPAHTAPILLGMGKLGGRELNFSSDVDLIFSYALAPEADPDAAEEYFARLARDAAQILSDVTEDGFVYRVDTLLRPFGSVGAAAVSLPAMVAYYQNHGREWERYAFIKARVVAGDAPAGAQLLEALQPFVYRRYLDYGAIGALRDLKRLIDVEAQRHGAATDIKLGRGGIRELEFVVQLFQLVRGGQDRRLQSTGFRSTLAQLGIVGLLDAPSVAALDRAYVFLRRAENALQFYDDRQTHHLPTEPLARAGLCAALDFVDWEAFSVHLDGIRHRVHEVFERVFAADETHAADAPQSALRAVVWEGECEELTPRLRVLGYRRDAGLVAQRLVELRESRRVRVLGDMARARLEEGVTRLVTEAAEATDPETALTRALEVVAAIGGRSTYLALLRDSHLARAQLLRLTSASPWITRLLAQSPALLDTLLDPRLADAAPLRDAIFAELALRAGGVDAGNTEASMELLRRYRQETMLRVAAADLAGTLPLVQVSDRLTWLAEAVLAKALDDATVQLSARYGRPQRGDGSAASFAVLGYGKFGSLELGYGSDLDIVFVFDTDDAVRETRGGERSLASADYFRRLGQRVVQLLSAMTSSGRAYEIDLELRPSGSSGAVVASFEGWAQYQRKSAWTWEHQALLRARLVAGDVHLGDAADTVRREVLTRPRDAEHLRTEVRDMRIKMRATLEQHLAGQWDVKHAAGGLVDAEFLVQFLLLRHAAQHPELLRYTDNWRQLDALVAAQVIPAAEASTLIAAARSYRNWLHRQALQEAGRFVGETQLAAERAAVRRLWDKYLEGPA